MAVFEYNLSLCMGIGPNLRKEAASMFNKITALAESFVCLDIVRLDAVRLDALARRSFLGWGA